LQGFQSSAPSPDSASLAISVSNDVDPLESEKMAKELEVDGKDEEGEIEGEPCTPFSAFLGRAEFAVVVQRSSLRWFNSTRRWSSF